MLKDYQKIQVEKGDSQEFIDIVNAIMGSLIFQYSIKEVVFVKIKNWFDHKWLNYSGQTVVPFDFGGMKDQIDAALENVWREKISVPPFNPNRVVYSKFFIKQDTGNEKIKKTLHRRRSSKDNIHNRIAEYTSNGLFIWFSSNTQINQRGSIMAYRVKDDQVFTWYATVEKIGIWQITKTKGIGLNELKAYIK
ncbi:MAG: hypothetical protein GC181_13440 [Bacteroidetes bacterium]|nr:hypothetical protein [Bacteroidota bacterium]